MKRKMLSRRKVISWLAGLPGTVILLAACGETGEQKISATTATQTPRLDKRQPAPDFDNEVWINTEKLKLADLRGKVVLVEFWTFGCYNCRNVQPALKNWYQNYHSQGLEIVAIHSPEFDYEKKLENVQQAVKEQGLKYPVALDNDFKTWNKYRVRAWPSLFLVDKQGQIRYSHVGEGNYELTEAAIKALLDENG
jgi:thiol-disulfide isomerase/thioredoxin